MRGDRAKRAAAKAAAHDRYAVLDHLEGGDRFAAIARMSLPRVRQAVDGVHRGLRDRERRRVGDDGLAVVELYEPPGVVRVRLVVDDPGGFGEEHFVVAD